MSIEICWKFLKIINESFLTNFFPRRQSKRSTFVGNSSNMVSPDEMLTDLLQEFFVFFVVVYLLLSCLFFELGYDIFLQQCVYDHSYAIWTYNIYFLRKVKSKWFVPLFLYLSFDRKFVTKTVHNNTKINVFDKVYLYILR